VGKQQKKTLLILSLPGYQKAQ
jgi:hypothetical protein